tara:strand:+ start:96 stop:566 length:471 start_codon:yes stop_codon:yes gene_type:complete
MAYIPQSPSIYQGNQILLNSDRLIFNAQKDSILLFSDKVIGFSTNGSFHFDTSPKEDSKFVLNSPNIYLGLEFDNTLPKEPAVLGHELADILNRICNQIMGLMNDIEYKVSYTVTSVGSPTGPNPLNKSALQNRYQSLKDIMADIDDILSENTKLV